MRVVQRLVTQPDGRTLSCFEKRLSSRERDEPASIQRLRDEAYLLGALRGQHVTPRLIAAGDDGSGPWLQTERLAFPTLATRLEQQSAICTESPALGSMRWLERAIGAAYRALGDLHAACDARGPLNLVHADISPANVAVDDLGEHAVFLDLELAVWRESAPRNGAFCGTLAYAAPELARGETPTVASDIYALAASFVHVVSGSPPREKSSLAAMLIHVAEKPILEELRHRGLDLAASNHAALRMLAHCLAHEPRCRPTSAANVAATATGAPCANPCANPC